MALTYNSSSVASKGNTWTVMANLSPDTSYPAGGYDVSPQQLRLSSIESFIALADQYYLFYDKTTGKLRFLTTSGGGGPLIFTGSPMSPHAHLITRSTSGLAAVDGLCLRFAGAPGTVFTVGETITGGTSGATGTVIASSSLFANYTPVAGRFDSGEVVTGSISGATANADGLPFKRFLLPSDCTLVMSCYDDDITFRTYQPIPTYSQLPHLMMTCTGVVGTFINGEAITGGTSGATGFITLTQASGTHNEVTYSTGTFQNGETITGGTSGATAVLSTFYQERLFYHNTTPSSIEINSGVTPDSLYAIYQETSDITSITAGTPAGTISGGGGGAGFVEVTPGTNVYAVLPNFQAIITGL